MLNIKAIFLLLLPIYFIQACPDQDSDCLSCAGKKCTLCMGGYANIEGKCVRPKTKIWRCITYNKDETCKACKFNYKLSTTGTCELITDKTCVQVDKQGNCALCQKGIMMRNNECDVTNTCGIENCDYCGMMGEDEACFMCAEGYVGYINKNTWQCVHETISVENCWFLNANNPTRCAVCRFNSYFKNGFCEPSDTYKLKQTAYLVSSIKLLLTLTLYLSI